MRTAITTVLTHSGEHKVLFHRDDPPGSGTPLPDQIKALREMRGLKEHSQYAAYEYQESDQPMVKVRLRPVAVESKALGKNKFTK